MTASGAVQLTLTVGATTPALTTYSLLITGQAGAITHSLSVPLTINFSEPIPTGSLPANWNASSFAGSSGQAAYGNGVYAVTGQGAGITVDQYEYAFTQVTGNGSIVARVTNPGAGGGIMVRSGLGYLSNRLALTVDNRKVTLWSGTGISPTTLGTSSITQMPQWLQLTWAQNVYTAFVSLDGTHWNQLGAPVTTSMPGTVDVGLIGYSGQMVWADTVNPPSNIALYDNVAVSTATVGFSVNAPNETLVQVGSGATSVPVNVYATPGFSGTVALNASGFPTGVTGSFSPTSIASGSSNLTVNVSSSAVPGTYPITITGTSGSTTTSTQIPLIVGGSLLNNWSSADIGYSALPGTSSFNTQGVLLQNGAGNDAGLSFQFGFTPLNGDGTIQGRLLSPMGGAPGTSIMIRNDLSQGSSFMCLYQYGGITASSGSAFPIEGDELYYKTSQGQYFPGTGGGPWLQLTRQGSTFTASTSPDGTTWTQAGSVQLSMNSQVLVGFGVYSGTPSSSIAAQFDNVSVTSSASTTGSLQISTAMTNVIAGTTVPSISIRLLDGNGNLMTSSTAPVTLTWGELNSSPLTVSAVNGVATFSNVTFKASGSRALFATSPGMASAISKPFSVTAGSPSTLQFGPHTAVFINYPLPTFTVQVQDVYGNLITNSGASITLTSNPSFVSMTATAVNGIATFNLSSFTLTTAGTYTLTASASGLTGGTTSFTINPGSSRRLGFTTQPANAVVGSAMNPVTVQVQDYWGNSVFESGDTVNLTSSPSGISATANSNSNGVVTFSNLVLNTAGTYTLTASNSYGLISATSNSFNVTTTPVASQLSFATQPTSGTAGSTMSSLTVQIQDSNGHVISGSTASVTLTSSPAGISTTVAAVNGVATFSGLHLNTSGTYTLGATSSGLTGATSNSFSISAAAASQLKFTTQPANTSAGTATPYMVIQVQDAYGNLVSTSSASISLSSSPAGLSGSLAASNGSATFNVTFNGAGTYTISASSSGLTSATSNSFTVTSAAAAKLKFSSWPSSVSAGTPFGATVQIQDTYGNLVSNSSASVSLVSSPSGVSTSTTAVNGVASFSGMVLNTAGTYTLTASSAGLTSATSSSFTVTGGAAATQLKVTTQPANATAGATLASVVVQIQTSTGSLVSNSTASVTLVSSPAGISKTVSAVGGVATFSGMALNTAGSYTFTATSTGLTSATSNSFTISAAAASQLKFTTQPIGTTAGSTMASVVVQVQDTYGNAVTGSTASVTLTSSPAGISKSVSAASGVATFSGLVLTTSGSYTLTAASSGLTSATSSSFSITAGTAKQLKFTTQPANTAAGSTMASVVVQVQDTYGNLVTGSTASITLASTPAGISKTVSASGGSATFTGLVLNTAGSYTLTASSSGLTSATSSSFTISAAAASQLKFTTQPVGTTKGSKMAAVVVQVQDTYGNLVITSSASITLKSTPSNVSTSANASGGVATFSNLVINTSATYTLTASSSGLTSATSNSFVIK